MTVTVDNKHWAWTNNEHWWIDNGQWLGSLGLAMWHVSVSVSEALHPATSKQFHWHCTAWTQTKKSAVPIPTCSSSNLDWPQIFCTANWTLLHLTRASKCWKRILSQLGPEGRCWRSIRVRVRVTQPVDSHLIKSNLVSVSKPFATSELLIWARYSWAETKLAQRQGYMATGYKDNSPPFRRMIWHETNDGLFQRACRHSEKPERWHQAVLLAQELLCESMINCLQRKWWWSWLVAMIMMHNDTMS